MSDLNSVLNGYIKNLQNKDDSLLTESGLVPALVQKTGQMASVAKSGGLVAQGASAVAHDGHNLANLGKIGLGTATAGAMGVSGVSALSGGGEDQSTQSPAPTPTASNGMMSMNGTPTGDVHDTGFLSGLDDSMPWLKYAVPGALAAGAGALYLRKRMANNR